MDKEKEKIEEEIDQSQELDTISPVSEHQEEEGNQPTSTTDENKNEVPMASATEDSVNSGEIEEDDSIVSVATDQEEAKPSEASQQHNEVEQKAPVAEVSKEMNDDKDADTPVEKVESIEESHEDDHFEEEKIDYSVCSKEELVELVKKAGQMDHVVKSDNILMEIKPFFDEIRKNERNIAQEKFIKEGGVIDDFEFRNDELNTRFDANYRLIKDKKSKYFQEREKQKDENLKKKQDILEKLREFVDSDETNISFDSFKALQNQWKSVGQIPIAHNKTLWANYNALLDRFYDKRSIYFELKELDRKKNLEIKIEICERAEALINEKQIKVATNSLNDLHNEYKHVGPVPKKDQEPLWQRFKAASDAIYDKRKEYVDILKGELEENLVKKEKLCETLLTFTKYDSDRIKEWNEKTKEILAFQKQWEAIGGMPREKGKEVNKKFWSSFKTFFHNKGEFFKRLDQERGGNLTLKEALVQKANELKDNNDWINTANELKKLQRSWKEIGPVPEKHRNEIYKRFKEACDYFFDQKRVHNQEADKEYEGNLNKKLEICEQIEVLAKNKTGNIDQLRELQTQFNDVGFVPKLEIGKIKSKYADAVDRFINSMPDVSNEDRHQIRLENQLNKMMSEPNSEQKMFRKEQATRKHIGKLENDISLWTNNMEFFASSKTADKLKNEFEEKIDTATKELQQLKKELKLLRSAQR
ncbi:MAG: DUF349 domain-containing protein [Cyclobacteriaceae bacterium]|nr:DUF349 domain-containing protein [Cyclobacteriaceae bacterium]